MSVLKPTKLQIMSIEITIKDNNNYKFFRKGRWYMKNKEQKEIFVPRGYELEDILDVEEDDYDLGEPVLCEEVSLVFEWY